ncbi:hypothetical protein HKX48_009184, partial [Thoreauomyces humboldtii]
TKAATPSPSLPRPIPVPSTARLTELEKQNEQYKATIRGLEMDVITNKAVQTDEVRSREASLLRGDTPVLRSSGALPGLLPASHHQPRRYST